MSKVVDAPQRARAIEPNHSFCVSAPAGSGKTELLIQRYLGLLSRVTRPEQVLAITFTRKAAAEMRERVLEALRAARDDLPCDSPHQRVTRELAGRALAADAQGQWQLLRDISRLNIKTIDSFCAGLTRQMPVLSEFGGQANVQDDNGPLYREAVVELFRELERSRPVAADLAALMLHFDNNWERLQDLLVSMLMRREQWRGYIGQHHQPEESESYLVGAVESVVCDELHELGSMLLANQSDLFELACFAAGNLGTTAPDEFPEATSADLPAWRLIRNLLLTKDGSWRKRVSKTEGFPTGKGEPEERKEQLKTLIAQVQEIEGLQDKLAALKLLPEIESGSESWQLVLHLSRLLPVLAAQLLLVFQKHGVVDHNQVALSALQALGEDDAPTDLALRLDYQIEHILVDEFQDTAVNQYELLRKLTRGWGEHNEANPDAPRTLLIVGDAMQSIYGFRGANVGLFLKARREGFNGIRPEHLELHCNFRSDEGVVHWVNDTFRRAFPLRDDINRSQISYSEASAVRETVAEHPVEMHAFCGDESRAEEAQFICRKIAVYLAQGEGDIAVLGRSRSHLQALIAALKESHIPYNAQDLDSLASSPVVADLLTLCSVLANPADRLAWMALLRAPWCGLTLADLLSIARHGEHPTHEPLWSTLRSSALQDLLSEDGVRRLQHLLAPLELARNKRDRLGLRVWIEQAWLGLGGPECAADANALRDAESFFQLLEDADAQGLGLDVQWLTTQLENRYMNGGDPASPVHLMTLHKAKGLEFNRVIIPQLDRLPRGDGREILLWDEHSNARGQRSFLLAADDHSPTDAPTLYNYLREQRQRKSLLESTRLLYVGATRAVSHLLLTASVKIDDKTGVPRAPAKRALLSPMWPTFEQQMTLHECTIAPAGEEAVHGDRLFRRLREFDFSASRASAESGSEAGGKNTPERPDNHLERSVGTVVHLALEQLSLRDSLPDEIGEQDSARWRLALQREGLWGVVLQQALDGVVSSVERTLAKGGAGRWVLSSTHAQARSEWALTTLEAGGRIRDIVIDRTFIDADSGTRWIVDYKNSRPAEGENLEVFTAREAQAYREQLQRYRDALREIGDEPVQCALFFTALGHLHPLDDLELPAVRSRE